MSEPSNYTQQKARHEFDAARRKALIAGIFDALLRQPNDMLSLEEVRARLKVRGQRYLGLQSVPVALIIGSEGRYLDFDRNFLPRSASLKARWASIDAMSLQLAPLPPVELYKIDDVYFVRDGNHRVSVARQRGQQEIDANVTELLVDVPLEADDSVHDLLLKEEYSDFLEWTELHLLRPSQFIEFSEPGGYLDLIRHINAHRYFMGLDLKREVTRTEAVAHWYDTVYLPVVQAIRRNHVLDYFPDRSEADLYRWIAEHRWTIIERTGSDPGPERAVSDYLEQYLRTHPLEALHELMHHFLERLGLERR